MQLLPVTNLPIYLPADKAQIPFGDPLSDGTATAAAPGVFTVPGYNAPAVNDALSFSFITGGSLPAPLVVGTVYYVQSVVSAALGTFTLSATKGGAAITTTTTGASFTTHLMSAEVYGVTLPFKPSNTVVVSNTTGGSLVLQSAPDLNTASYGNPQGPGTWTALATVAAGAKALAVLNNDWLRVSTAATLYLEQN